jgi:hypothetical protein
MEWREILRIIKKASVEKDNFFWQTHPDRRDVTPIDHFEIDYAARDVVVTFRKAGLKISRELPLYVKLDHNDSVFKTTDFKVSAQSVQFSVPKEVKTLELRESPRHFFRPDQFKIITVKPTLGSAADISNDVEFRVIDISETGMGLVISENNRSYLKNNRILWITHLQRVALAVPMLAEIVYITSESDSKLVNRREKELKVGMKLSAKIAPQAVQNFIL